MSGAQCPITCTWKIILISTSLTDSQMRLYQGVKVNDLLVNLPSLNTLDLCFNGHTSFFPNSPFAFKAFPSVSKLTLRDWPFHYDGPMSVQHQLGFATLKHLKLQHGYVSRDVHTFLLSNYCQFSISVNGNAPRLRWILKELID